MLPDPLHPVVVHFPIVLGILLPFVTIGALWAIRNGAKPLRAWGVAVAFGAALTASAVVAEKTGEAQEDRVEYVVSESRVETHAAAAEALVVASIAVLLILAVGLMPGITGTVARFAGVAGAFIVAAMVFRVGMTGGDLVYKYGAASAYTTADSAAAGGEKGQAGGEKGEKGEKEESERGEKGER